MDQWGFSFQNYDHRDCREQEHHQRAPTHAGIICSRAEAGDLHLRSRQRESHEGYSGMSQF
jgi:hypothetical protein